MLTLVGVFNEFSNKNTLKKGQKIVKSGEKVWLMLLKNSYFLAHGLQKFCLNSISTLVSYVWLIYLLNIFLLKKLIFLPSWKMIFLLHINNLHLYINSHSLRMLGWYAISAKASKRLLALPLIAKLNPSSLVIW